jgi:hypothetical protein
MERSLSWSTPAIDQVDSGIQVDADRGGVLAWFRKKPDAAENLWNCMAITG